MWILTPLEPTQSSQHKRAFVDDKAPRPSCQGTCHEPELCAVYQDWGFVAVSMNAHNHTSKRAGRPLESGPELHLVLPVGRQAQWMAGGINSGFCSSFPDYSWLRRIPGNEGASISNRTNRGLVLTTVITFSSPTASDSPSLRACNYQHPCPPSPMRLARSTSLIKRIPGLGHSVEQMGGSRAMTTAR
jgi:hypothetical protein